jgi:hypothetical protein
MPSYGSSIDNQPLHYYNGKPIYLTMYVTAVLTLGIIVTVLLSSAGVPEVLTFYPAAFMRGFVWQPLTYVFVNPISFFTPLGLLALYFWGVEVEKYLGRRHFIGICGVLIFLPVVISSICYLSGFAGGVPGGHDVPPGVKAALLAVRTSLSSDYFLISGLLIAFAALYPEMDYIGGWIPLKWFAFAMVACGSLMYFPERNWVGLLILWANCAAAYAMVRHSRGLFEIKLPKLSNLWPRKTPNLRVLPKPISPQRAAREIPAAERSDAEDEMDVILDKIASSGLQSLGTAEKARLETLRQQLLRKGH